MSAYKTNYLSFILIMGIFFLLPSLAFSQFKPDDRYSFDDYKTHGMLFTAEHQGVVDKLVGQLLKAERAAGYFGGSRQEDTIRDKVKKNYALSRGLYSGKIDEDDSGAHKAVYATNEYLKNWRAQMPEIKNMTTLKSFEAKVYNREVKAYRERQNALSQYPPKQTFRGKQYSPEAQQAAAEALAAKHQQIDRAEKREDFQKKVSKCEDFCSRNSYSGLAYFECVKSCKDY